MTVRVSPSGPARSPRGGHLHQIDLVRLLVFASVIMVHTLSRTNPDASVGAGYPLQVLHFTREAFFALSGFVLVYGQRGQRPSRSFLGKRIRLVLVPYLAWTLLYWAVTQGLHPLSAPIAIRTLAYDALTGGASYHLYFLLVTLQIYLTFGGLQWLLARTRGHHGALLAAAAAYQLVYTGLLHYVWRPGTGGAVDVLFAHADSLIFSYVLWVVAGGVAATHLDRFDAWVLGHGRVLAAAVAAGLALDVASYAIEVHRHATPVHAADVLQPVTLVWSAAAIVAIYRIGLRWATRPRRRLGNAVAQASLASFGVFLVHPLVLQLLTAHGLGRTDRVMPRVAAVAIAYLLTALGASVATALLLHTRLSLTLTGRPRIRPARPADAPQPVVDDNPLADDTVEEVRPVLRPPRSHRRPRVLTVPRIAAVVSLAVFATSVVAPNQADVNKKAATKAADEFTPVNSLVPSTVAPVAGHKTPSNAPAVQTTYKLQVGNRLRSYLLVTPAGGTKGLPLLVFLHGVTTTPGEELTRDGFEPLAQGGQAVLAYPGGVQGSWNAEDGCCQAAELQHVDDVAFVQALIKDVHARAQTDAKRVYLAGFSNGAKLVWTVACKAPAGIAAFAEFGGNPDPCPGRATAPYFIGVGGKDGTEPILGKAADTRGPHPAVAPELARILARNGCASPPTTVQTSTALLHAYTKCRHGDVEYVDWLTSDHHWPRPPTTTPAGSAATLVWEFFRAQHL